MKVVPTVPAGRGVAYCVRGVAVMVGVIETVYWPKAGFTSSRARANAPSDPPIRNSWQVV